jgi:nitrate reductase NapAB chaperone NapD
MTSRLESLRSAAAASALSALRGATVAPRESGAAAVRAAQVVGVVIETAPGAEPRVAARLLRLPWIALQGGDGDRRIAAVLEAAGGASPQEMAERLLAQGPEILAVLPTFAGSEED